MYVYIHRKRGHTAQRINLREREREREWERERERATHTQPHTLVWTHVHTQMHTHTHTHTHTRTCRHKQHMCMYTQMYDVYRHNNMKRGGFQKRRAQEKKRTWGFGEKRRVYYGRITCSGYMFHVHYTHTHAHTYSRACTDLFFYFLKFCPRYVMNTQHFC